MAKVKVVHGGKRFREKGDLVVAICASDGVGASTAIFGDVDEEAACIVGYAFGGLVSALEDEYPELARCMRSGLHASIELEVS